MYHLYVEGTHKEDKGSWAWILVKDEQEIAYGSGMVKGVKYFTINEVGAMSAVMHGLHYCLSNNVPMDHIVVRSNSGSVCETEIKTYQNKIERQYAEWMRKAKGVRFESVDKDTLWYQDVSILAEDTLRI